MFVCAIFSGSFAKPVKEKTTHIYFLKIYSTSEVIGSTEMSRITQFQ